MEGSPVSPRMLLWCHFNPHVWTDRWRKRKQRRKTNHLLHTSQSVRGQSTRRTDDLSKRRKVHCHSKWKSRQDAVCWINVARAQEKGLQFWQTRSHATIVYNSVPPDCIYKVKCQKGKELYMKDSQHLGLHRKSFSRVLGNHSSSSHSSSSKTPRKVLFQRAPGNWCEKRTKALQQTTQNDGASGNRCEVLSQLLRKEEPEREVDLRIEGIAQDVIPKEEEIMGSIQKVVDKLRTGYNTKSIVADLEKTGESIKFSEESSRTVVNWAILN